MIGLVFYVVVLAVLLAGELYGVFGQNPRWLALTDYVQAAPVWIRAAVYLFTLWLTAHFLGVL